ncbi:MAG: class I SAM-dependent methyltransferase [Thermoplasmatota archaeon]
MMDELEEDIFGGRFTASIPMQEAEKLREILMENDLFDPTRSIGRDVKVHFPVKLPEGRDMEWFAWLIDDLVDIITVSEPGAGTEHRDRRPTPFQQIRGILENELEPQEVQLLPDRWEMIGDCLVLKIDEGLLYSIDRICTVYQEVLGARFTLVDMDGIQGELRKPDFMTACEPEDGNWDVIHTENGVKYQLDPRKIMFSSGNVEERTGIVELVNEGPRPPRIDGGKEKEIVVDMFAGIGYFTLPIAVGCDIDKIYALEKNPESFDYLERNIDLNDVRDKVVAINGDNREVAPKVPADRVIMGYLGGTIEFLERAMDMVSDRGAMIHLHDTVKTEDGHVWLGREAEKRIKTKGWKMEMLDHRKVKSYAPRIDHIVLDLLVMPDPDVKL